MRKVGWGLIVSLLGGPGCAGPVAVTRTYTPDQAARMQGQNMVVTAVMHGDQRIPLPRGARVAGHTVVLPRAHVHRLAPGDVIETDEAGQIVAVRSAGDPPIVTRFVPGTATSPADSDLVRGELADDASIALAPEDGVEMKGTLPPDAAISGVGRVESTRATGALVGGLVLFALSYGPSLYVGAQASEGYDRALLIPVAGPWIDLAQRPGCVEPQTMVKLPVDPCQLDTLGRAALVASGGVQGLATILTAWGLPSHSELVPGDDRGAARGEGRAKEAAVAVAPGPGGVVVSGSF